MVVLTVVTRLFAVSQMTREPSGPAAMLPMPPKTASMARESLVSLKEQSQSESRQLHLKKTKVYVIMNYVVRSRDFSQLIGYA